MPEQKGRSLYIVLASLAVLLLLVGSGSAAKVNYIYDELNRLIQVEYPDGTVIKYEYDKLGNRTYKEMLKNPFTLTVEKTGVGPGIAPVVYSVAAGIYCGVFCEGTFSGGGDVTLTLLPDSDYELTGWSESGCIGENCTVTMDGNKTVTAAFALLPPAADFTASPTDVNETPVSFTDASRRATSWYWEFGDGFTSTEQNPTHIYPSTGTYTVSLTVTDSSGLTSTKIREDYIRVTALSCNTQHVQIDKPSEMYFDSLQEAYNNATDDAEIKIHAITLPGNLIASKNRSIKLIGGYQCDYSEVIGTTAVLGSITIDNGSIDVSNIEIFSGTSPAVSHQIHASAAPGGSISPSGTLSVPHGGNAIFSIIPDQNYQISDVRVDGTPVGTVDSYLFHGVTESHVIEATFENMWLLPVADFTASPTTVGELSLAPVSFIDNSLRAETWSWDFGDGNTSTEQYPIHTYSTVGTYTVSLTVSNDEGRHTKTAINYITVLPYENYPVQVEQDDKPSVMFSTLQEAYDYADYDAHAVIKAVAATQLGNLDAKENKSVALEGGFNSNFSQQIGTTALLGSIAINSGVLDIRDVEIITGITRYWQISASSNMGGSISPAGMSIAQGGNATFTILPDQDHLLVDVLVDGVSVGVEKDTYTFINVSKNHTIEAEFAWKEYTISIFAGAGGTISPSGVSDTVNVPYGSSQEFTITPDPGFHIVDVSVDGSTIGAVTSYIFSDVKSDHFIEATFSNTYMLTVVKTGNGSGSVTSDPAGIDCGTSCLSSFVSGSTITLNAAPQPNTSFGGWSGGGCSGTDPCEITLNSDIEVNAIFNLILPPVANFSATNATGIKPVTVNFYDHSTGSPTSWFWDFGDTLSSSNTSTLQYPTHTYSVPGMYTVTLTATNAGGSNTLTITDIVNVRPYVKIVGLTARYNSIQDAYNAAPDLATIRVLSSTYLASQGRYATLVEDFDAALPKTITLEGGCEFNLETGEFDSTEPGMTTMIGSIKTTTGDLIIEKFELISGNTYTIDASADTGGSISPSGTLTANENSNMKFEIVPQPGYRILDVVVDGGSVGARPSYTFTSIASIHTIAAKFTNTDPLPAPYSLSVTPVSPTRINLEWIYNSTTETGFIIDRKTGINGTYNQISLTASGVTIYSDTGLIPDTEYYYRVRAINELSSSVYSPEVGATTPDTTPLSGSVAINGGATYANAAAVTLALSCSGAPGCAQMQFSNDNTNWSAAEAYAATKSWTLATGDGTKTVYVKYKDIDGNWSTIYSDTIILDTTAPTTTASPAGGTYYAAQNVTLTASEPATIYYTTDGSTPTMASAVYSGAISLTTNMATTLKYFAEDSTGNSETVKTQTYFIDIAPPAGSITINSGATYTTVAAVTLALTCSDATGCAQMQFSNDNVNWSAAEAYAATKSWTLATGDGTKTVYVKYKDGAGLWSTASITDAIILDTTSPTGTVSINGGATYTNVAAVTLALTCNDATGCAQMQFSNDNVNWSAAETYAVTKSWTLTSGDGTKTVYVKYKDSAGNWSTAYSDTIILDTTTPETTASPSGGTYTATQAVILSCNDGTGAGCDKIYYTTDGTTPTAASSVYSSALSIAATTTVKYFATDFAGNSEAVKTTAYTIDNATPTIPVLDNAVTTKQSSGSSSISSPSISTAQPNELLVAFIASDGPSSGGSQQITAVSGGGLTWTLRSRANAQAGTAEIWTAPATNVVTDMIVTATRAAGSYQGMMTVAAFQGASLTVNGAAGNASAASGAPAVTLTTTQANSLVWGVGDDWDNAVARTVDTNQTKYSEYLAPAGDTFWVQYVTAPSTAAGVSAAVSCSAPTNDRWNFAAIEIVPN